MHAALDGFDKSLSQAQGGSVTPAHPTARDAQAEHLVAAFEGEAPALSRAQFAALLKARAAKGSMLSDAEARSSLSAAADGGDDGH
jgi:hypothetical protein